MSMTTSLRLAALSVALTVSATTLATSTDGFHSIEIVPVVVNTASFSSEIYVHNPNDSAISVNIVYHPAAGTAQATTLNCGNKTINAHATVAYFLPTLCPGLPAGSNFGWLEAAELDVENRPFNVFVRVNNPQGQGFAIEGYPPHTFTAADMYVTGLKRQAAAPGFQTNCFFGALSEATELDYKLFDANAAQIGSTRTIMLAANEFVRVLDVFGPNGVNAPVGDYSIVTLQVIEFGVGEPGAVVFCTVQNNTTFDADFRIGKAFEAQDDTAWRTLTESGDATLKPGGDPFRTGVFPNGRNRHIVYFKHPDRVKCSVTGDPNSDGLEMRLVAPDGVTVVAGGSNSQSFPEVNLGAKATRNGGANGRWYIDVEGTGVTAGDNKLYSITCSSGSGHTSYGWVGRNLPDAM